LPMIALFFRMIKVLQLRKLNRRNEVAVFVPCCTSTCYHVGIDGDSTKLVLWIFLLLAAYSENIAFGGNLCTFSSFEHLF